MIRTYHRLLAWAAMWRYGRPSRHLIVIGVTGTDGKTTTATLIAELFQAAGFRVGLSSSAWFQVAGRRWLNETHMTMPGRFGLQRLLRDMVQAGCQVAVLEVSSEGIAQARHNGIDFDGAVLTNITPEHIQAHGSFEAYRTAKARLFERLIKSGDKHVNGLRVKEVSVVNLDDPSAAHFLRYWADEHYGTTMTGAKVPSEITSPVTVMAAESVELNPLNSHFRIDGHELTLNLPGRYNVANAVQAVTVARAFGVDWSVIKKRLAEPIDIPGRGQTLTSAKGFSVIIDYALTPAALREFYQSLKDRGARRIIAVFGAAGGGRDAWKRPQLGRIAAEYADLIVLTTDDPYEEPPAAIAAAIAAGVPADRRSRVSIVLDRRTAIAKAIEVAEPGDIVAVTGMGAETSMMVNGKKIPWSDAGVVQEMLRP